ncbi:MAG: amino acid ABC transporter substrate-binding protein [Desulfobacteraceae bacterium]|nr:amino acid ABC transporter substrate-binding protein [Desulfobacteraceae bacterium]
MKKLFLFYLIISIFSVSYANDEINIRVSNFPPQYFKDSNGKWTGLDVELARAIVLQAGLKPVFVDMSWQAALIRLRHGQIQILTNVNRTPERENKYRWIGPERQTNMALIVKMEHSNVPIKDIDDLIIIASQQNKKFGIEKGVFYSKEFNDRLKTDEFNKYFEIINKTNLNFEKLRLGRILGFFEDKVSLSYKIRHDPEFSDLVLHGFQLHGEPVYFAITPKISDVLFERLENAFLKLENNGSLEKIRTTDW